jgi:hypothetical protein
MAQGGAAIRNAMIWPIAGAAAIVLVLLIVFALESGVFKREDPAEIRLDAQIDRISEICLNSSTVSHGANLEVELSDLKKDLKAGAKIEDIKNKLFGVIQNLPSQLDAQERDKTRDCMMKLYGDLK